MKATRIMVLACALLAVAPSPARASVDARVERVIHRLGFAGAASSVTVFDDSRGRLLAVHGGRRPMRPGSNVKLATALALLGRMGEDTLLHTRVLATGTLVRGRLDGRLWLVGAGDPSFSMSGFARRAFNGHASLLPVLADAVRRAGIREVAGRMAGDENLFDTRRTAPFWKPSYWNDCPPIGALSVNEDWVGMGPFSYPSPALRAARVMRRALESRGVRFGSGAMVGDAPPAARRIASVASPSIARLVRDMNRSSDNFYAEVLLKRLAVARGRAGTTANGVRVVHNYLEDLGLDLTGARLFDGSGLSTGDRLSSRQLVAILRRARTHSYRRAFVHSLPLAGVNGTLKDRMRSGPAHRNAQAKTGTIDGASALSGYVSSRNGHKVLFSILQNRRHIDLEAARRLQDRIVQLLAGSTLR